METTRERLPSVPSEDPSVLLEDEEIPRRTLAAHPGLFALLQWPALAGMLAVPLGSRAFLLDIPLALWVAGVQVLAFRFPDRDNLWFGFSVLGNNVLFAAAWRAYPHWTYLPWAWLLGVSFFSSLALLRLIRRDREFWREGA